MNIAYHPSYRKENTKYFAVHNAGPLSPTDPRSSSKYLTAGQVDEAHRWRFHMLSSLGFYGGYNFYIEQDGSIRQFRTVGEETAANRGHNFNGEAISVCLAGNFTQGIDIPTEQQKQALRDIYTSLGLTNVQIVSHRAIQSGTDCYGSGLDDSWARSILSPVADNTALIISLKQQILALLQQLLLIQQMKRLGRRILGVQLKSCEELEVRG